MSITEKLLASKNALANLLAYANAKTGKSDPDIGEAIRTLVDGYGGGGGLPDGITEMATGTVVFDANRNLYASNYKPEHGMSAIPRFAAFFDEYELENGFVRTLDNDVTTATQIAFGFGIRFGVDSRWGCTYGISSNNAIAGQQYNGNNVGRYSGIAMDATYLTITGYSGHLFPAGHTLRWICWR